MREWSIRAAMKAVTAYMLLNATNPTKYSNADRFLERLLILHMMVSKKQLIMGVWNPYRKRGAKMDPRYGAFITPELNMNALRMIIEGLEARRIFEEKAGRSPTQSEQRLYWKCSIAYQAMQAGESVQKAIIRAKQTSV